MSRIKMGLQVVGEVQASKLIALHCLGLLVSLRDGHMSIEEVESFFLPWVVKAIKELNIDCKIVGLIELGCELEDINSLLPERLEDNINSLIKGFSTYLRNHSDSEHILVDLISCAVGKENGLNS